MDAIFSSLLTSSEKPIKGEALVAFMHERHGAILITYKGEGIAHDVEMVGPCMEDFFNDNYPDGSGMWMWEGKITVGPKYHDFEQDEPQYSGKWRRLNEKEIHNLTIRGNPWWAPDNTEDWFNKLVGNL